MKTKKARFHRATSEDRCALGMERRVFLMTATMVGVTTGAMLAGAKPGSAAVLSEGDGATLLRMTQDIYPHPELLSIDVYEEIAGSIVEALEEDDARAATITDGIAALNALANELHGADYVEIDDADARESLLRAVQDEAFFQDVRWTAYFGIYDNKELWPLFGYEGSSVEYGGYIDRGFSDITFVPRGPSEEQRLARVR